MAPEEAPGTLPGASPRESAPPVPTSTDPEKGGGALLLGTNAAGDVIDQYMNLSDTASAVVIPMTGEGER